MFCCNLTICSSFFIVHALVWAMPKTTRRFLYTPKA